MRQRYAFARWAAVVALVLVAASSAAATSGLIDARYVQMARALFTGGTNGQVWTRDASAVLGGVWANASGGGPLSLPLNLDDKFIVDANGSVGIHTAPSDDSALNLTQSINEGFGAWVNATLNGTGWLNAIDLNSGVAAGVAGGTIQSLVIEPPTLGSGATLGTFQGIAIGDLAGVTVGSKAEAINYADKFIVDASGTVFQDLGGSLPGTTLLTNQFGPVMAMAIQYDSNEFYGIVQLAGGNNAYGVYNEFVKSRSTDGSTPAAAQAGDTMMYLESRADDGAGGIVEGPRIITEILSAPVVGNLVPSRVVFSVPNADGLTAANAFTLTPTVVTFSALTTTGAATGKKVVCVDTATGQLYASSTGTDCSN